MRKEHHCFPPSVRSLTRLFLTVFLCGSISMCSSKDDVSRIKTIIREAAALAEEHQLRKLMNLTSDDFTALPGPLQRKAVKGILWRAFHYYGTFQILHPAPKILLGEGGTRAEARVPFLIVKKGDPVPDVKGLVKDPRAWIEALGEKADLYRLDLIFHKTGDTWTVIKAKLGRFTGLGFHEGE